MAASGSDIVSSVSPPLAMEAKSMSIENRSPRRWLAFSLRELLFLPVIAGLAVGWSLDHRRLANSEIYRVGNGVLETVRKMYEEDTADPVPIDFCYKVRPFQVSVSLSAYYVDVPTLPGRGGRGLPDHP
jgi:hypothetical protein